MTFAISTPLKSDMVALIPPRFNGGVIRVFGNTKPDYPEQAENQHGGVLLGYITNGGLPPDYVGSGLQIVQSLPYLVSSPFQSWVLTPTASGIAKWFRFVADQNDDGGVNYSKYRMDGSCGADNTFELVLPTTTLTFGQPVFPLSFFYTIPPIIS